MLIVALVVAVLFASGTGGAWAESDAVWPVKGRLLGKPDKDRPERIAKSTDVSGIACTSATGFPRRCLVIDDNVKRAQIVIVSDGQVVAGDAVALTGPGCNDDPLELDGEGVAFDNGDFYVIGSHGHPRDEDHKLKKAEIAARIRSASQVVRVRIRSEDISLDGKLAVPARVDCSGELRKVLRNEPAIAAFVDERLEKNGLTIEGVAVRDGRLYAGLRGPILKDGTAAVLSVSLGGLFADKSPSGQLQAPDGRLHKLKLQQRGVRDLAVHGAGFLVLAGPVGKTGTFAVYRWDGGERQELLGELKRYTDRGKKGKEIALKPEAILPLDSDGTRERMLLLFDEATEGGPRAIRLP